MANILQSITSLINTSIAGSPPPPPILLGIPNRLNELMDVSVDPSGAGITRWLAKLHDITNDKKLHETLLVRLLQMHFTRMAELLTLLGIIKFEWADDPETPVAFSIDWDKLNSITSDPGTEALTLLLSKVQAIADVGALKVLLLMLFSAPDALLALEYRKQGFMRLPVSPIPGIGTDELMDMINSLVQSPLQLALPFTLPLSFDDFKNNAKPNVNGAIGALIIDGPTLPGDFDAGDKLKGIAIIIHLLSIENLITKTIDLGDEWFLSFSSNDTGAKDIRLQFNTKGIAVGFPSTGGLGINLTKKPEDKALLIGEADGTHFSIKSIGVGINLNAVAPIFVVNINFNEIEFALKPDFLKFLSFGLSIPNQLQFQSDLAVSYVQGKGLTAQGTNGGLPALGMQFTTPLNLKIGGSGAGISVDQVTTRLEVKLENGNVYFQAIFRYGATAQFGPLKAILDGAGVWVGRWTNGNGGLLPPQGIGISLDAGPVSGGGFLKIISDNEFAGALQIKILGIGAFAYCIYKTLPTGQISFVALIGIRLPPPGIQISFGFAVSGFGGLVGINRKADTDLIRERLASGGAGDVLFNDDPMKNAPKLLGDMQLFFPDEKGSFLIGPTLQINWLYIIKLDLGFFIQIPGPKFFIAGSAKLVIGSEEFALVYLRMDFVGGIDFAKSLIFFDAALVNSNVLAIFKITGGVALRISYGENGYFLFSVGGFHPAFNPGAMELPKVPRVGVGYSFGVIWLKQEMYLAVTSNTFQLGCKIEAGLEIGPIAAHGWFAFDALIQFKPFYFVGNIDAGFDVEVAGVSLCSVHVSGLLSGPGPLVLQARASVKILFVRISGDITIELNSNPPENIITIKDIPNHLKDQGELKKEENLRAEGDDKSVVFGPSVEGVKLYSPVSKFIWEQKRVPLNLNIQKVEGIELEGWHKLEPSTTLAGITIAPQQDWFGVGTFLKLPDSEALNNARFVLQQAGIIIGDSAMSDFDIIPVEIKISLVKLPKREKFALFTSMQYVNSGLASLLGERINGPKLEPGKAQVTVGQEEWNSHSKDGAVQNSTSLNAIQAFTESKITSGIALPKGEKIINLTGII